MGTKADMKYRSTHQQPIISTRCYLLSRQPLHHQHKTKQCSKITIITLHSEELDMKLDNDLSITMKSRHEDHHPRQDQAAHKAVDKPTVSE